FVDQNEMQEEFRFCKQLPGGKKKFRDFQSDRQLFSVNMIYPGQNVSRCAQTVQEPCMTHCMLHRENFVAKDMSDEFSNVRSLTRSEIGPLFSLGISGPRPAHFFHGSGNWINEATVQLLLSCSFLFLNTIVQQDRKI